MPADTSYLQIERASFEPSGRPVFLQRQTASDAADSRVDRGAALPSRAVPIAVPHAVRDVISSTGKPLDTGTRHFMESRFGHDFSQVRVHTDAAAEKSARSINARAYTVGSDVAFGPNEFAPETQRGRELLAHELTHTIQQSNAGGAPPSPDQQGVFEKSADAAAHDVASGRAVTGELPSCGVGLSRSPGPDDERAKAIAEAQALVASSDERLKDDETQDEPTATIPRKSKTSSKFLPGGFTDKDVYKEYEEAKERMKLADLAIALAEKQVKRHEFWDTNPSNNTADAKKAFALDLYWDPNEQTFTRQPYVTKQEDIVRATPESKRIYDDYLWNATVNKPEQKGLVRRVLDPPVHFVCKHTNPCSGIIDQMHRDRESGMAEVDVKKNALARLTIEAAMFFAPGEGPSGPIDISKGRPGGGPFETPAFETGTPTALEKPSETANTQNLESRKLEPTKPPEEGSVASTTAKEEAVPEAVSEDANTERIRPGRVGEIVGDFEIAGDKGMKGDTFERNIYGLSNTRGKQTDIGPVMDLFRNFIKEAKAAGAKNLRITGNVIRNRNVLVMKRIVEKFGGTIRQTGDMSTEINIPID